MENNYFDKHIRDSLKDFGVDYNPRDWELFERKFDAEGAASDANSGMDDIYLDGMAFDSLHKLEVEYNAAHWDMMSQKLDEEFSVASKLYKYKVIEMALMLLAIFTLFQFLPIKKNKHTTASTTSTEQLNFVSPEASTKQLSSNTEDEIDLSIVATTPKANELASVSPSFNQQNNTIQTNNNLASTEELIPSTENTDITISQNNSLPTIASPTATTLIDNDKISKDVEIPSILDFDADKDIAEAFDKIKEEGSINKISFTQSPMLIDEIDFLYIDKRDEDIPSIDVKRKGKNRLRVGMFSIADYNFVMTPYDSELDLEPYGRWALGYGGGLTVGVKYSNNFEFEVGAVYTTKEYAPQSSASIVSGSVTQGGFAGIGLKAVELNMLTIPVNLRYSFSTSKNNKWQLYVLSGASLHLALTANYDREFIGNFGSFGGGFSSSSIARNAKNKFKDGILEGGSFKENRYLTANIGLGVERYLSPRWSLFAQPTYQHQLINQGLGPKNDRINSFSILFGGKVSL